MGVNAPEVSLNLWDSRKTEDPFDQFKLKFKIFLNIHIFLILTVIHLHCRTWGGGQGGGYKRQ